MHLVLVLIQILCLLTLEELSKILGKSFLVDETVWMGYVSNFAWEQQLPQMHWGKKYMAWHNSVDQWGGQYWEGSGCNSDGKRDKGAVKGRKVWGKELQRQLYSYEAY